MQNPAVALWRWTMIPLKRLSAKKRKPVAFVFYTHAWKTFIPEWIPGKEIKRKDSAISKSEWYLKWLPLILWEPNAKVYVWSYREPEFITKSCRARNIPIVRMEDGFLRSIALGAQGAKPVSLTFAEKVAYFDATEQSDLEYIIQNHDFDGDTELMGRARKGIARLLSTRLSKYNVSSDADIEAIYGPKTKKRILVVGQVEGDMSMVKGCTLNIDNNRLVQLVARENPEAQVIYKPHPEVLRGIRKKPVQTNPHEVSGMALVLTEDVTLADAFKTVDHVYTITSLSGFEALIRGIPVTCFGMPFYAGWGATDDRQSCPRRTARRTAEEIFAAAYILYPKYNDPITGKPIDFEAALELLAWMKDKQPAPMPPAPAQSDPLHEALATLARFVATFNTAPGDPVSPDDRN